MKVWMCAFLTIVTQIALGIDTLEVQVFNFDDPSPEGWGQNYHGFADFPENGHWRKVLMEMTLRCDEATKADQYPCGEWDYLTRVVVHVPRGDTTEAFELGSFVTPYGLGLDLGDGRSWVWDITDYQPLLKGRLAIDAGNNQELLDLRLRFIAGNPPRMPLSVTNVWPWNDYKYGELADDSVLLAREVVLPEGGEYRLMARISGHGHNGPGNCCEWRNKTHSYFFNDFEVVRWNVWKNCGDNPLYPQGGTWPFDRAGWCPGTKVDEFTFDFSGTPGETLSIDYDIEQPDDPDERDGDFRMSHLLFAYASPTAEREIGIYDIISPSEYPCHGRKNPSPISEIVIVNNGNLPLTCTDIEYGVSNTLTYRWQGELGFGEMDTVTLPAIPFMDPMSENPRFTVNLRSCDMDPDEYPGDNSISVPFHPPDQLPNRIVLHLLTNNLDRASELELFMLRPDGSSTLHRSAMADSTLYVDTLNLDPGWHRLLLTDKGEDGMSIHWWNRNSESEQVGSNGRLMILSMEGDTIKSFHPDFGEYIDHWFRVNRRDQ